MAKGLISVVLLLVTLGPAAAREGDPIRRDIDLHADFLSSPELAARAPGDPSFDTAVRYLVETLRGGGYAPGARRDYLAPESIAMTPRAEDCLLLLRRRQGTMKFAPVTDFRPLALGGGGDLVAPVILVAGIEDLSDAIHGRIVLLIGADADSVRKAAGRGPAAILLAADPRTETLDRVTFVDGRTAMGEVKDRGTEFLFTDRATGAVRLLTREMVREIELDLPPEPPGRPGGELVRAKPLPVPVLGISGSVAARILGEEPREVLAGIRAGVRPRVIPATVGTVRLVVPGEGRKVSIPSILARRSGTEPRVARQTVLVRIRYDAPDDTAATGLALAAELMRAPPGKRPLVLHFVSSGRMTVPAGAISIRAAGSRRDFRVPVGKSGARDAAVAAVRAATRIIRRLLDAPLPNPGKRDPKSPSPPPPPPPPPKGTLTAARLARYAGRLPEAERELTLALRSAPKDPDLLRERVRLRIAGKRWDDALAVAKELEALPESEGRADFARFEIYEAREQYEDAGRALLRAVTSGYPEAMVEWATRLPRGEPGSMAAATTVLRRLVLASPDSLWGQFAAGLHLYNRRDLAGAERYLGKVVEMDPLLGAAWFWRGKIRSEREQDPVKVALDFDRAARCGYDRPSVAFERGLCRLRARMYTLAIREFTAYLREFPNDGAAIYNIACAHALMRNTDEALDWLARSIEAGFDDPDHARNDPDFESLWHHPRFEALLKSRRTD